MSAVPLLLAVLAALCATAVSVMYRVYAARGGDLGALLLLQSLPTGLVMALLLRPSGLAALSALDWAVFVVSGLLWALMAHLDVRAYETMGAGVNAVLNTSRVVLLTASGLLLFAEPMSAAQALGCVLVLLGILGIVASRGEVSREGLRYRAACVLVGGLALTLDKWLTGHADPGLVTLSGYLVPGLLFAAQQRGRREAIGVELARSWRLLLATSALYGALGVALIFSLAAGRLWSTMLVYEARVVFTFAVGALWLGERASVLRRGIAALVCLAGVAVVMGG